jgi:hypothetical protein
MFYKHNSGYIEDTFDPRDVWADELFAGETKDLPEYHKEVGFKYEKQGVYPYCVSFACSTLAEWKYRALHSKEHSFSQSHLFYTSEGNEKGSSARQNLNVLSSIGGVDYHLYPMPENVMKKPNDWLIIGRKYANGVPTGDAKKIPGYMRVISSKKNLKEAILDHGALVVGVWVNKKYYSGSAIREVEDDNHVVLLVGWDNVDGKWIIFDSLSWVEGNAGYGTLSQDYTFRFAYAIEALPEDWKQKRDEARKQPQGALEHYGQQRVWQKELDAAQAILEAFKRLNNKPVFDAASRFWTVYINAVAYGGYSTTDILNDCYNYRRTGEQIFDFNLETRDQWATRVKGLK